MLEPRTIRVDFPGDIADALIDAALDEHRRPADQVVVFVRDRLREIGALPLDVTATRATSTRHRRDDRELTAAPTPAEPVPA